MEEFKDIEYYGIKITVSNYGKIIIDNVERKHHKNHDGYPVVSMPKNRNVAVHRLVAMAFVKNDDVKNKKEVNHLDFNRSNFRWDNLEWVTRQENIAYSYNNGRYAERHKNQIGEGNPNYGNRKLSKFYKENPEISKEKQGRQGLKNGRCRKIIMISSKGDSLEFDYIESCIDYIIDALGIKAKKSSVRSQIDKSIRNNKTYKGYKFYKE